MIATSDPRPPVTAAPGGVLRVAVTGGIGSGKSYLCRRLAAAGYPVFCCDDEAKRIIRTDEAVKEALRAVVGREVYDAAGRLAKPVLAAYLCRGKEYSARVDAIVHPRVARAFQERVRQMAEERREAEGAEGGGAPLSAFLSRYPKRTDGAPPVTAALPELLAALPSGRVLFMECALLYESRFDRLVDRTLLVHTGAETQLRRVMSRDGISREAALSWISLQLPEEERLRRADIVVENG